MDANSWRSCVLDVVRKIADDAYQREAWFGVGDQVSSPEELYCELFDDYIYDDFLVSLDINMTNHQRELGILLKNMMNEYANGIDYLADPQKVYDDPKWNSVREAAREFFNMLSDCSAS